MVTTTAPPKLAYTVDEAVKALGIGRSKLYEAIRAGDLRSIKAGGRTLIRAEALTAFLDAAEAATPLPAPSVH